MVLRLPLPERGGFLLSWLVDRYRQGRYCHRGCFWITKDTSYSWGAPRHTPGTLVPIILARLRVTACSFPDLSHCYP